MPTGELLRQGIMVFAIALAIFAQITVHASPYNAYAWAMFAIAALLAAAAAGLRPPPSAEVATAIEAPPSPRQRFAFGALAVAAIGATTYLAAVQQMPLAAIALWLVAPLLGSFAVRAWQITPAQRPEIPWTRRERIALIALVAGAALLRMLWIGSIPRGIFGDEPRVGMFLKMAFNDGAVPNFFRMGWNTWPVIGLSLQGLVAPLFGLHIWTLRASSAVMGTLGVLGTYLLARELFSRRAALAAAALFAVCRTAIDFSRLGIAHAQVLCFEPLAFFLLWRALNRGRALSYLWAGVATAWCLYSYNAGQLVPILVFGWLALGALMRPSRLRTHWRGAAVLAAAFALTLFPYLYYFTDAFAFARNWDQWTIMARNRQTLSQVADAWQSAGWRPAWDILSRQIWITWLGFGVLPGGGYGLGYRRGGMLDDVSAALFVLGLAISLRRLRSGRDAFVPYWWIATVISGGIATVDPPSFVRMVGLLPAIALFAALPLEWLTRRVSSAAYQMAAGVLAVALVGAATWENYRTYFVEFAQAPGDSMSELVRYMESLPADHKAALLGAEHFLQFRGELFSIEFPDRWQDVGEPAHFLPLRTQPTAPFALVLGPTQTTLSDYLLKLYPHAQMRDVTGPNGQPLFFRAVVVPPDDVRAHNCLTLTAQRADGSTAELGCVDPFAEQVDAAKDATKLIWTGSLYWPRSLSLGVIVDAATHTTLTIENQRPVVSDGDKSPPIPIKLARGWHPLRIEETPGPNRRFNMSIAAEPLERSSFRPETGEGLSATYKRSDNTSLPVIDPQLNAFAVEDRFPPDSDLLVRSPFTVTWRGALRIEQPGNYFFEALGSGPYSVRLDGSELLRDAPKEPESPAMSRAGRVLSAGLHPIEVDFDSTQRAHTTRRLFQLFWTPPGGAKQLIPPSHFVPAS